MYTTTVSYDDFHGTKRNGVAHFNLTTPQVLLLFTQFNTLMQWRESMAGPERRLDPEEVKGFYNNLQEILLTAWGEPSEDGMYFRKGGRYDFQESALFPAVMMSFLNAPNEADKLLDGLMPKDLQEVVKKAAENMDQALENPETPEALKAQIRELQLRNEALQQGGSQA